MKDTAFTIVAKNYVGLAEILKNSFKQYNENIDFKIFVADEFSSGQQIDDLLVAKEVLKISECLWYEMAFKYDLTEFCTSIKPSCFKYLFSKGYQKVFYFDPDILFFNSIDLLSNVLDGHDVCLTPHQVLFNTVYGGDITEKNLLGSGVFNLGFCGMKNSSISSRILDWWEERLKKMSFSEPLEFLFTDQKLMDMIPCFLDQKQLWIEHGLGFNVAPWNFSEREIFLEKDIYKVRPRNKSYGNWDSELVFVHYSGYNYVGLLSGEKEQKNIAIMKDYKDVSSLLNIYQKHIVLNKEIFNRTINLSYTYNYFHDGECISKFHRRIFNAWVKDGYSEDPFDTTSLFYKKLKSHGLLLKNNDVDRVKATNIINLSNKERKVQFLLFLFFKIIGIKKYILLVRFFRYYANFEKHAFLLIKRKNI